MPKRGKNIREANPIMRVVLHISSNLSAISDSFSKDGHGFNNGSRRPRSGGQEVRWHVILGIMKKYRRRPTVMMNEIIESHLSSFTLSMNAFQSELLKSCPTGSISTHLRTRTVQMANRAGRLNILTRKSFFSLVY